MFWCSLVGADCPPKQAMPVAIACLEQEDLGFGVLCWERKVIRAEKKTDGRVPPRARPVSLTFGRCGGVYSSSSGLTSQIVDTKIVF